MSATQQTQPRQHIGVHSFVIDCDRENDALLMPRPKLKSYWGLARRVPHSEKETARAVMKKFESLVQTKFKEELSAPKWQVWKHTWIKFNSDERSRVVDERMKEWYRITENLISGVHRNNQTDMDDVGWELYTRPRFDRYMNTLGQSKAGFRNTPYPPYTGYSGRVRQQAEPAHAPPPALPSVPDWLTLPGDSAAAGPNRETPSPSPGSHAGFNTSATVDPSASVIPAFAGLSLDGAAAPTFTDAGPSTLEVSPVDEESDPREGPSGVWSPLETGRFSVVSYEVSPISE